LLLWKSESWLLSGGSHSGCLLIDDHWHNSHKSVALVPSQTTPSPDSKTCDDDDSDDS